MSTKDTEHDEALALVIGLHLAGLLELKVAIEELSLNDYRRIASELAETGLLVKLAEIGAVDDCIIMGQTFLDENPPCPLLTEAEVEPEYDC